MGYTSAGVVALTALGLSGIMYNEIAGHATTESLLILSHVAVLVGALFFVWAIRHVLRDNHYPEGGAVGGYCTNVAAVVASAGILCAIVPHMVSHIDGVDPNYHSWNTGMFACMAGVCVLMFFTFFCSRYSKFNTFQGWAGYITIAGAGVITAAVGFELFPVDGVDINLMLILGGLFAGIGLVAFMGTFVHWCKKKDAIGFNDGFNGGRPVYV